MPTLVYDPVAIARQFLFVRELAGQQNRGRRVEAIQHWSLGNFGDSWCDEFAALILDIAFQGNSPFPREADVDDACEATLAYANNQGWILGDGVPPMPGDLIVSIDENLRAHHIGIYTGQTTPEGETVDASGYVVIAGNTSADGSSANGDRVAEHAVSVDGKAIIRYPR